ncbi:single-stranded-DNA-specific exonuclease RecJ [Geobacter sp. DSM 9736]|uniref:single-stranded-DNA-specific exonuclease RecJ n=1 Tax=Geobacter sp. DSM 9736 TaxID=1277350 RepID=UPI000B50115C|nr:single-stranded-DNA-specific exonuclease RecJ [Geobacter sp. DSM 9736]SNB44828.1 exonuclease RecJ [Geobacter sp. DSM 9736]
MKPVIARRWNIRNPDRADIDRLTSTGIPPLLGRILLNRGISDPDRANLFLSAALGELHDPFLLHGMEAAVERLTTAIARGERVCVYGDYDVDGITSVALLIGFFRAVGLDCFYYIPHRLEEGYGLAADGIEAVAARGARIIVTVDCGITAVSEAALCKDLGLDLIITDHHTPPAKLPEALALVNPLHPDCRFPFKQLAGVGVAFNLLIALRSRLRELGFFGSVTEPNLREFLDLVALGTIADIVPLIDENRIFARHGLIQLSRTTRPGVEALKRVAGISGAVSCGGVGFRLAPRLNAAGRLEDAALGVELLLSRDAARSAQIALDLDRSNAERQAIEQEILRQALAMVQDGAASGRKSIVLSSEAWHPGVIGIVASRIVDIFYRPTVLIALQEGSGRGSGRSIPNFHLHDALNACSEHLVKFGGHKYAAGLTIDEATLEAFVEMFDQVAAGSLSEEDLTPEINIDAELDPTDITLDLADQMEHLAPFGAGNPEPVFALRRVKIAERRILKESHLKLRVAAGGRTFEAIGFNMAGEWGTQGCADIAFTLQKNVWNGRQGLQLRLKDIRPAEEGDAL